MFDRIIASLYGATLDDSQWRTTSTLIDEACGTFGNHRVLVGRDTHGDAMWLFDEAHTRGELREDIGRDYAENCFARDERMPRLLPIPDRLMVHVTDLLYGARTADFRDVQRNSCAGMTPTTA